MPGANHGVAGTSLGARHPQYRLVDETSAERQGIDRDALIVAVHALLVRLFQGKGEHAVRLNAPASHAGAVGRAGTEKGDDGQLRIQLASRVGDGAEERG